MIRILMVEGSLSDSIQLWLWNQEARDIITTTVPNIRKGLLQIQKTKFDLVFLDFNSPDNEEIKTVINIINRDQKIPILVCSTGDDESVKNQIIKFGATEHINKKKLSPTLFISKIKDCVASYRA